MTHEYGHDISEIVRSFLYVLVSLLQSLQLSLSIEDVLVKASDLTNLDSKTIMALEHVD